VIGAAAALTILFGAHDARSQGVQPQTAPATASGGNLFSRWFGTPAAATQPAAAPASTAQAAPRVRKPRISRTRKRARPVAARPAPSEERPASPQQQAAERDWPDAAANVGGSITTMPLTIKTVREQLEPAPELPVVDETELTDIDRAADPRLAASVMPEPAPATDGSGAAEHDAAERARVLAMGETMKAMMQSAWLEPLMLVLAGALAGLAASRVFA
jgi:hypothetical protein